MSEDILGTVVPPQDAVLRSTTELSLPGQVVLILCGLIASGKSTFAEALQEHIPQFRRCNQDDLGDRRLVERLARSSLADGSSICIDRTNFNIPQRAHWIKIAQNFPGTVIWVIVFDTPYEVCAARLRTRQNHPTITNAEDGLNILSRFAADFVAPAPHEGYNRILYLRPEEHPSALWSKEEIIAILERIRDSPVVVIPADWQPQPLQGQRGRTERGRGRGRSEFPGQQQFRGGIPRNPGPMPTPRQSGSHPYQEQGRGGHGGPDQNRGSHAGGPSRVYRGRATNSITDAAHRGSVPFAGTFGTVGAPTRGWAQSFGWSKGRPELSSTKNQNGSSEIVADDNRDCETTNLTDVD